MSKTTAGSIRFPDGVQISYTTNLSHHVTFAGPVEQMALVPDVLRRAADEMEQGLARIAAEELASTLWPDAP